MGRLVVHREGIDGVKYIRYDSEGRMINTIYSRMSQREERRKALALAVDNNDVAMINLLQEYGLCPEKNYQDTRLAFWAFKGGKVEAVKSLLGASWENWILIYDTNGYYEYNSEGCRISSERIYDKSNIDRRLHQVIPEREEQAEQKRTMAPFFNSFGNRSYPMFYDEWKNSYVTALRNQESLRIVRLESEIKNESGQAVVERAEIKVLHDFVATYAEELIKRQCPLSLIKRLLSENCDTLTRSGRTLSDSYKTLVRKLSIFAAQSQARPRIAMNASQITPCVRSKL